MDNDNPARDLVLIRNLRPDDIGPITAIDEAAAGRRRDRFLAIKMKQAFADTGIAVSLAAELDDHVVGFLLARLYYGEFGGRTCGGARCCRRPSRLSRPSCGIGACGPTAHESAWSRDSDPADRSLMA